MKQPMVIGILAAWLLVITIGLGWLVLVRSPMGQEITNEIVKVENSTETTGPTTAELSTQIQTLTTQVNSLQAQIASFGSAPVSKPATTTTPSAPSREYYVPLGSGSTSNRDWTPLTSGGAVTFDPRNYQPIKAVYFEAAGSIIGGEVHAVLVDVTNNVTFFQGELVFNTSTTTWQQSPALTLATTPSQLQVQILSTSGELAVLNDSRLVIETGY